jgi:hypothetical protein
LLAAISAPEHTQGPAILGIKHLQNERGLITATAAQWNWIRLERPEDLVCEFIVHEKMACSLRNANYNLQQVPSYADRTTGQFCKAGRLNPARFCASGHVSIRIDGTSL